MLCSKCKKNSAIIFVNDTNNKDSKDSIKGLCYDCAKSEGIDALEVLAKQNDILGKDVVNLQDFSGQFENIFKDLSKHLNIEPLGNLDLDSMETEDIEDSMEGGFPLGSIFAGFVKPKNDEADSSAEHINNHSKNKQKNKEKKSKNKKHKFLDTYGTNLTTKAKYRNSKNYSNS